MRRTLIIAALLGLAGCQSVPGAGGESPLAGRELDSAVGLYGPWAESLVLDGRRTYVWRRRYEADAQAYYCELRVETGFRRTISHSVMQGFPAACRLFSVRYVSRLN